MADVMRVDAQAIRAVARIQAESVRSLETALTKIAAAQKRSGWDCPEKATVEDMEATLQRDVQSLSQRIDAFASACTSWADALEQADARLLGASDGAQEATAAPQASSAPARDATSPFASIGDAIKGALADWTSRLDRPVQLPRTLTPTLPTTPNVTVASTGASASRGPLIRPDSPLDRAMSAPAAQLPPFVDWLR